MSTHTIVVPASPSAETLERMLAAFENAIAAQVPAGKPFSRLDGMRAAYRVIEPSVTVRLHTKINAP